MINHMPFFRFPFFPYSRTYARNMYPSSHSMAINGEETNLQNPSANINDSSARNNHSYPHMNGSSKHAEIYKTESIEIAQNKRNTKNTSSPDKEDIHEKRSSKYYNIGPIFLNTNGFSDKEKPLLEISGRKLYLDDLIILSLLFILYKEDVKDDMLFIILILLLVT